MLALILAGILSLQTDAQPQAPAPPILVEKQLGATLRNKIITLRSFSKSAHQHFGEDGQWKDKSDVGSWTIYSQVLVNKVEVAPTRVRISGVRIIHHYDAGQKKLVASPSDLNVEIDLDIKKGATTADVSSVAKNFLAGPEGLVTLVPAYWRRYLGAKKDEQSPSGDSATKRVRVGGSIIAANLIKQVRPQYAEVAKAFLLEGVVALEVEISETGDIENINITQPAGAGFDESAVEAVSQWKYKPTLLDGNPVRVVTTITVNYRFSR